MFRAAFAMVALSIVPSTRGGDTPPFRYSYYLFELPGDHKRCSDCYIPLLVTRDPLEKGTPTDAAMILTYERDSIWSLSDSPVKVDAKADERLLGLGRKIRIQGKGYRYQLIGSEETVHLLKNPLGTIPIHRVEHPINGTNEPLRKVLLADLGGA